MGNSGRTAEASADSSSRRWPRWQFSLRVMIALTVLVAAALAALHPYRQKERAIARLDEIGAVYYFDYQLDAIGPGGQPIGDEPQREAWKQRVLGRHYASNVIEVQLYATGPGRLDEFTDADAALLAALPTTEYVALQCPRLTDAGLRSLAALAALKGLNVIGSAVTREGVAQFQAARPNVELKAKPAR